MLGAAKASFNSHRAVRVLRGGQTTGAATFAGFSVYYLCFSAGIAGAAGCADCKPHQLQRLSAVRAKWHETRKERAEVSTAQVATDNRPAMGPWWVETMEKVNLHVCACK